MAARIPITVEARWEIAARMASILPVIYGIAFRDIVGDAFDRVEQQVWVMLAREAKAVARAHSLPVTTAGDLASTLAIITTIFFGSETTAETASFEGDRAVLLVRRCPFLLRGEEFSSVPGSVFNRCMAFSIATVEALNPGYTLRFVRGACQGDRNCEMKIAPRDTGAGEKSS